MLHGSIQFFLGYVVSTLLLAALEEPACMKFLRERGGTPLFRGAGALMLFSLALLPLLASLTLSLFSALTLLQAVFVT